MQNSLGKNFKELHQLFVSCYTETKKIDYFLQGKVFNNGFYIVQDLVLR